MTLPRLQGVYKAARSERKIGAMAIYTDIDFMSEAHILRGRHYAAAPESSDGASAPCVIMAHGTSATISMALDKYAAAFQSAGLNVVLYDHAGLGASDGAQRQVINPWVQARGYRDACTFVQASPHSYNGQIFIWGDSYAGMLVLLVGAFVEGLAGIVSHIPATGPKQLLSSDPAGDFKTLQTLFETADLNQFDAHVAGPMPVVSADPFGVPSLLLPIQAYTWFISYGGQFGSQWQNSITRVIPETPVPFAPQITTPFLTAPTMMLVGRGDEMVHCNSDVQKAVFDSILTEKEFYEVGGGHFGCLYAGTDLFDEAVAVEIAFIKRHSAPRN